MDVISRFYPRTQDEYLNPGIPEGADEERAENARWERLLSIAERTNDNRPVLTSEYAHSMGNALGNFQEYWDEIYSNHRMLGGFIWDWVDQGIIRTLPDGREQVAYGGDFGDQPNLKAFCMNGIVRCDRTLTPKYWEVKKVYQPVYMKLANWDAATGQCAVEMTNHNHHVGMEGYRCLWTLLVNGRRTASGEAELPYIMPAESKNVNIDLSKPAKKIDWEQDDVRLNLSIVLRSATDWAEAGYEVAAEQIALKDNLMRLAETDVRGGRALELTREGGSIRVRNNAVDLLWDEGTATLRHLAYGGREVFHAKDSLAAANFHAFRAPTDNDKSFGNWLAKDWKKHGMHAPRVTKVGLRADSPKPTRPKASCPSCPAWAPASWPTRPSTGWSGTDWDRWRPIPTANAPQASAGGSPGPESNTLTIRVRKTPAIWSRWPSSVSATRAEGASRCLPLSGRSRPPRCPTP